MKIKVSKNWHGYVSVRDFKIDKARDKGEDLIILHDGRQMTIPHANLDKGKIVTKEIVSKINGKKYNLVDFLWNPDDRLKKTA